jgi:hypothetical protein
MGKRGPRYTPKEAEALIPEVLRRMTLTGVELLILLDTYPIDSREVEVRVEALKGLTGRLIRLCHVIWRYEGLKRGAAQKMV